MPARSFPRDVRTDAPGSDVSERGHHTILSDVQTGGLGTIHVRHPPGTFAPTPASRITVAAVGTEQGRLEGAGIDWGAGVGCVAIAAARVPGVSAVVGLEIVEANARAAMENARSNGVADRTGFYVSDSYEPRSPAGRSALRSLEGSAGFVVANPPAASRGDGFGWRREVARGALRFLRPGGLLLIQVSTQYGLERVRGLEAEASGLRYDGVAVSSNWVSFELERPARLAALRTYVEEERRGGLPYGFRWPGDPETPVSARDALDRFRRTGTSPLSRWQVHRFIYS